MTTPHRAETACDLTPLQRIGGADDVTLSDGAALRIERRDPDVPEQLRDVYDVIQADVQRRHPDREQSTFAAWLPLQTRPDEETIVLVASMAGAAVGVAKADLPLHDNTTLAPFTVLVHPECRRRGIGTELLTCLLNTIPADRTTFLTEPTHAPDDGGPSAFAARCGFHADAHQTVTELTLPLPAGLLDEVEREIGDATAGYRVETHVGGLPEPLQGPWMHLLGLLYVDAPSGSLDLEQGSMGAEQYREHRDRMLAAGRVPLEAAAWDDAGELVAMTQLFPCAKTPRMRVTQGATYVHRNHRGHRLGLAIKVATLRALTQRYPEHHVIRTYTDDTNLPMRAVNDRLGFVPVAVNTAFVRRRPTPGDR